jgi:Flp pilus assembly CpaF family ATPase
MFKRCSCKDKKEISEMMKLDAYREAGQMLPAQYDFLVRALRDNLSVAIVGKASSDRATLLEALLEKHAEVSNLPEPVYIVGSQPEIPEVFLMNKLQALPVVAWAEIANGESAANAVALGNLGHQVFFTSSCESSQELPRHLKSLIIGTNKVIADRVGRMVFKAIDVVVELEQTSDKGSCIREIVCKQSSFGEFVDDSEKLVLERI